MNFLGIDPGKRGGAAIIDDSGAILATKQANRPQDGEGLRHAWRWDSTSLTIPTGATGWTRIPRSLVGVALEIPDYKYAEKGKWKLSPNALVTLGREIGKIESFHRLLP